MTREHYVKLMEDDSEKLSPEEIKEGWHFCYEFDGLLIGPEMGELHSCRCLPKDHPVYQTAPPIDTGVEGQPPF